MKTYKTTTRSESLLAETTCDLCKARTVRHPSGNVANWSDSNSGITRVEITLYDIDGDESETIGEEIEFDICPRCFRDQLMPWLQSKGAVPHVRKW